MRQPQSIIGLSDLKAAAQLNPFDWHMRTAPARNTALAAVVNESQFWKTDAIAEIEAALVIDSTDAGLLQMLIMLHLSQGETAQAQRYYDIFKRVDRKSPLIELVTKSHQRQPSAVAAEP